MKFNDEIFLHLIGVEKLNFSQDGELKFKFLLKKMFTFSA